MVILLVLASCLWILSIKVATRMGDTKNTFGSTTCGEDFLSRVEMFLPTIKSDAPFLPGLFSSIEIFFPCTKKLTVVTPAAHGTAVVPLLPLYARIIFAEDPLPEFGYLSQQIHKIYADKYTTGDYILILEADSMFIKPVLDSCFFLDKKIAIGCRNYLTHSSDNNIQIWRKGTEFALQDQLDAECLVQSPLLYPREVFNLLRRHIQANHPGSFALFIQNYFDGHSKGWTLNSTLFSEFQILNHFMIRHTDFATKVNLEPGKGLPDTLQCSLHLGAMVERDYSLENPKLNENYFNILFEEMDKGIKQHCGTIWCSRKVRTILDPNIKEMIVELPKAC